MTTVTYKGKNKVFELAIEGHADYAKNGEPDIVCASESILSYQLGQIVQDMFNERKLVSKPKICLHDGYVRIKCIPHKEYRAETAYAFYYALTGYLLLAKNYPENITVKCRDELKRN